jgi:hypothetical protein
VPPFFITDVKWNASSNTTVVPIVASGVGANALVFTGSPINLEVLPMCLPGNFVDLGTLDFSSNTSLLYQYLLSSNSSICNRCTSGKVLSEEGLQCHICPSGTFADSDNINCVPCVGNTWSLIGTQSSCPPCPPGFTAATSRDRCITLVFASPPPVALMSLVPFRLPPVVAVDNFNISVALKGPVSVTLSCAPLDCSAIRKGAMLQTTGLFTDGSVLLDQQVVFDDSDSAIGTGYSWTLASTGLSEILAQNAAILFVTAVQSEMSYILGPLPFVESETLVAPFSGNISIVVASSVWNILSKMKVVSLNRTAVCRFVLWDRHPAHLLLNMTLYSVEARSVPGGDANTRMCTVPEAPPLLVWNVTAILADGRSSANNIQLDVVCPNSFYLQNRSCVRCPSDDNGGSFNELINAPSVESCRCSPGSYGTFGLGCVRCPSLEGFNCSLPDQAFPVIRPGYYGDYSLLPSCSWKSEACAALQTCPFGARACPGGGDKVCTNSEDECYTGRACSQCCTLFYLELGVCNKCPSPSTSNSILAAMAAVAFVVALLLATSSSPSFTQSIKYFILGMNFFQNLVSIKLINIQWPVEFVRLFEIVGFFSFSIGAVRPECSFSWTYEYKMLFSLLLPLIVSAIIGLIGFGYGILSCRRLLTKIRALKSKGAKLYEMRFSSLVDCWLHVMLFRPVVWKPDTLMWFALSPYLENRAVWRRKKSASENWSLLKKGLRRMFLRDRMFSTIQLTSKIFPLKIEIYDVKRMQSVLHDAGLDASFASMVMKGRKFSSGIFSVLVLFFVGSLTASVGALICEPRDDSFYLVQDPTVECDYSSTRYKTLIAIAVAALFLYVIVVPVFLVVLLGSKWSQDMRTGDRNGYDAFFGFLTGRYSLACYLWESVMFVYKGLCVMIPAFYSRSPITQSVSMMFVSLAYVVLLFKYSPFANNLMNAVEKATSFSMFLMYFIAVMFVAEVDGKPILDNTQRSVASFFLIVICGISALFCFLSGIYEYFFTLLFHGDIFVSKWMRAFQSAIGDSLNESLFLHFYAFYNPKSRKNLVEKKRVLNESIAILMAVKHSEVWKRGSLWVRFKLFCSTLWQWMRFGVKNRNLAECQPMVVHEALQYPEAQLFQRLSKIMHHINNQKEQSESTPANADAKESCQPNVFARCWRAVAFWRVGKAKGDAESAPMPPSALSVLDPPADFMETFVGKYEFLCNMLTPESLGILATMLVFDQCKDAGDSKEAQAYLQHMKREFEAFQKALRAVYAVAHEIIEEEERVQQTERWIVRKLKRLLLGEEGACLFRFSMFSPHDLGELFGEHNFEDFSRDEMLVIPVPQLLATHLQVSKQEKSLAKFLRKSRKKSSVSDISRSIVANNSGKPVLHQSLFLKNSEVSRGLSGPALASQRIRPRMFASKLARSDDGKLGAGALRAAARSPVTSIDNILMRRMLSNHKLVASAGIRGEAILIRSSEMDPDDLTSKQDISDIEWVVSGEAASDCIWVSEARLLNSELVGLKEYYRRHDIDEDSKVEALVKHIEESSAQLAQSVTVQVKNRRKLESMTEELKNLRAMAAVLQSSKESELEKLRVQFAYDLSLKDFELRSKDAQLVSLDVSLQALCTSMKFDVIEQPESGISLKTLRDVLAHALERGSSRQQSAELLSSQFAASSGRFSHSSRQQVFKEENAGSSFDAPSVSASVRDRWQERGGVTGTASPALGAQEREIDARVASEPRRQLKGGKEAGTGVDRV